MPLSGNAPILGIGLTGSPAPVSTNVSARETSGTRTFAYAANPGSLTWIEYDGPSSSTVKPKIYADLSAVTAATINQLRQSFQIQRIYERDARGGTRYTEILKAHFGVTSPDARLQRPEYLGGSSTRINVNPIAQTSATVAGQTPLATLSAMGTVAVHGTGFVKSFVEHGYILGLASVS